MDAGGRPASERPDRITFRRIFWDAWHRVVEFDLPALRTIRELTVHPDRVIVPYIEGERGRWTNPVQLYLIVGAVSIVVMKLTLPEAINEVHAGMFAALEGREQVRGRTAVLEARMATLFEWFLEWSVVLGVLTSPLMALPNRLLFRRRRYNTAEHTVVVLYASVPALLGSLLASPLYLVDVGAAQLSTLLVMWLVLSYAAWRVFGGNPIVVLLKAGVGQAFYLSVYMLAFMAAGVLTAVVTLLGY